MESNSTRSCHIMERFSIVRGGGSATTVELESLRHQEASARAVRNEVVLDLEHLATFHENK